MVHCHDALIDLFGVPAVVIPAGALVERAECVVAVGVVLVGCFSPIRPPFAVRRWTRHRPNLFDQADRDSADDGDDVDDVDDRREPLQLPHERTTVRPHP